MKYFSKTVAIPASVTKTILDLEDVKSMFTACKATLLINRSAATLLNVNLRSANGDKFVYYTGADAATAIDISNIVLSMAALPGTNGALTKIEVSGHDMACTAYISIEKLDE